MIYIKTNKIKDAFSTILGGIIILFINNPLCIASYYWGIEDNERNKKLNRLSRKMLPIANNFTKKESPCALDNINRVELFYKVYENIDYLTLKELKILRNFCYALEDRYDLRIKHEVETEDEIYRKYSSELDEKLEKREKEKII